MADVKEHKLAAISDVRRRLDRLVPRPPVELRPRFWDSAPTIVSEAEVAVPREERSSAAGLSSWPAITPTPLLEDDAIRTDFGHAMGALLGLAVGDAFGTTLEFTSIDGSFRELVRGPQREIIGEGPFGLEPGQVTDDTQMAICLFDSIVNNDRIDANDLLVRYRAWKQVAFDIGNQTRASLAAVEPHGGRMVWEGTGRRAAGNGGLMRTAPIGVLFGQDPDARRDATFVDGALTHFDPRSQLACASFNAAIGAGIELRDTRPTASDLVDVARSEVVPAARTLADRYPDLAALVDEARAAVLEDLELALAGDPQLYGPSLDLRKQQGFVRVAFRLAFWELIHAPSFEDGIVDAANRGGDADTNAAIAGALLGAHHGIDAIPDRWLATVLGVEIGGTKSIPHLHPARFVDGLVRVHGRSADLAADRARR